MKISKKNIIEMKSNLLQSQRELLNLRIQGNQLKKTHMVKKVRRNIARVKTFLKEKEGV